MPGNSYGQMNKGKVMAMKKKKKKAMVVKKQRLKNAQGEHNG